MFKRKSSELTFGLCEQPPDSCPHVVDLLDSIDNLFDREEDEEVQFDNSAASDVSNAIESLNVWGNSWLELGEDIILPFLDESLKELNQKEETEDMSDDDYARLDRIQENIESINDIVPDFTDDLKRTETDLLFSFSGLVSDLSNGDESAYNNIDSFRGDIKAYRETISHYKEIIKEVAFDYFEEIPELSLLYQEHIKYTKEQQQKHIKELKNKNQKNKKSLSL